MRKPKDIDKWEMLQNVDMTVRELQISLDTLKLYPEYSDILETKIELEKLRSNIHKHMNFLEKNFY